MNGAGDTAWRAMLAAVNAARRRGGAEHALELALERQFACSQHLAVYGTLAPGESNHREVAQLVGTWSRIRVRGHRAVRRDPVFRWDEAAPHVDMLLLTASALAAQWPRLDAFEGTDYRRILVPAWRTDDTIVVVQLYEATVSIDGPGDQPAG